MLGGPSADPGHIVDIDDAAYRAWRGAWLKQILLAGARTAIVLNDILDASGAARLERRSGVSTRADEAKEAENVRGGGGRARCPERARAPECPTHSAF